MANILSIRCVRFFLAVLLASMLVACGGEAPRDVVVEIPAGTSIREAGEILEQAGALSSADALVFRARLLSPNTPIIAGEYQIEAGMDTAAILALLQSGRVVHYRLTIPEGTPSILVHERLMNAPHLSGEIAVPEEGSILPETYSYTRGESRAALVRRMQRAMDEAFADLWPQRSPHAQVADRNQAVTLASIIEKETALGEERRRVAGVFTNRLARGIRLQADPTIIYPITRGRPLGRRIRRSEINATNDYNTYSMVGLPKAPITNPGRAALAAALDPEVHDYLFFVARGDGGHVFAKSNAEHERNVAQWYALRRKRGEM